MGIVFFADRGLERNGFEGNALDFADPFRGKGSLHLFGNLLGGRVAPKFLHELSLDPRHLVDGFDHMDRNADRPGLIGDGAGDGLADPPSGVSRELEAFRVIEFLDGLDKTHVPFLDEVQKLHPAADVMLRDGNDESQVGRDEFFLRRLARFLFFFRRVRGVPGDDRFGELGLFLRAKQRNFAHFLEVHLHGVVVLHLADRHTREVGIGNLGDLGFLARNGFFVEPVDVLVVILVDIGGKLVKIGRDLFLDILFVVIALGFDSRGAEFLEDVLDLLVGQAKMRGTIPQFFRVDEAFRFPAFHHVGLDLGQGFEGFFVLVSHVGKVDNRLFRSLERFILEQGIVEKRLFFLRLFFFRRFLCHIFSSLLCSGSTRACAALFVLLLCPFLAAFLRHDVDCFNRRLAIAVF